MSNDKAKAAAGYAAADLVKDNMKVGLGTGSTAFFFIKRLIERCREGLKITCIATSKKSTEQAKNGGLTLIQNDELITLDIDIDGADEIDKNKQMIKGGGGALFREKIIANASKEMIVVIDESKLVKKLGAHPLPIEIAIYGHLSILEKFKALKLKGSLRKEGNKLYITDNNNYIFDADISQIDEDYRILDSNITKIPGVIETGFFWELASKVIIGYEDGHFEIKETL